MAAIPAPRDAKKHALIDRSTRYSLVAGALLILVTSGLLVGLHFGQPHLWSKLSSFAKKNPVLLAGGGLAVAVIAGSILLAKHTKRTELITSLAVGALFIISMSLLQAYAPKAFHFLKSHPELIMGSLAIYTIVRITHLIAEHKIKELKEGLTPKELVPVDRNPAIPLKVRVASAEKKNSSPDPLERGKENIRLVSAAMATVLIVGVIALSAMSWSGVYQKINHLFHREWRVFTAASISGLAVMTALYLLGRTREREEERVYVKLSREAPLSKEDEKVQKRKEELRHLLEEKCKLDPDNTLACTRKDFEAIDKTTLQAILNACDEEHRHVASICRSLIR